jgi:glycosyltransferase involved in cell wall biosynthesis
LKKIIGTHRISYLEQRNFASMPFTNYQVKKVQDFIKIPAYLFWKIKHKPHRYFNNLFWDFGLNQYDILHFFHAINIGNQPWISSFSNHLPRAVQGFGKDKLEEKYIRFVIGRMQHDSCKKLIALSNYAYRSQKKYLDGLGINADEIFGKSVVMHPPQPLLIKDYSEKKLNPDKLTFCIVGADFFRKGGKEILLAFDKLLSENKPVQLTIISNLNFGDYASHSTIEDFKKAKTIISKHEDIIHYNQLPNQKVLEILKNTHVGLLPTYAETYGYSALEAQAAGCPVITTNGAALPEINNNIKGWMIELPVSDDERTIPRTDFEKKQYSDLITVQLYELIAQLLNQPKILKTKADICLRDIEQNHSIELHTKKLETIYDLALEKKI